MTLSPAAAVQRSDDAPRRPALLAGADTNDALAYYDFGVRSLRDDPRTAADAFYWSTRLDPSSARYLYARRAALLLADRSLLRGYVLADRSARRSPQVQQLDSLMWRALVLDPFLHRSLDEVLIVRFVIGEVARSRNLNQFDAESPELLMEVNEWITSNDRDLRAYLAYARGHLGDAITTWGQELRRNPRNFRLRAERARALFLFGSIDSARVELGAALLAARARDAESTNVFYESKASWEYGLGRIFERQGRADSARAAFERALVEDISYFPAHVRLGTIHLARGDTVSALREFGRAVDTREDDYLSRLTLGSVLAGAGHLDSAAVHLRRSIALEPHAARPRLTLGAVLDARGDAAGALAEFEAYLARATRADSRRAAVSARVDQLRTARP